MDYVSQLRQFAQEREQTLADAHDTKAQYANIYEVEEEEEEEEEEEDVPMSEDDDDDDDGEEEEEYDDDDDISLDEMEMEAYMRLKMAKEVIAKRETEGQRLVATSIIPYNEPIEKRDKMMQKLQQMEITSGQPWAMYLSVSSTRALKVPDVENDLQREMEFYEHALNSAHDAVFRLREAGIPNERPDDYFAEMVKSDDHMTRVKHRLLKTRNDLSKREESRRNKELKRFGKQIQVERMRQKLEEKKQNLERIKQWKKLASMKGQKQEDIEALINAEEESLMKGEKRKGRSSVTGGAGAEDVLETIKARQRAKTESKMKANPKFATMVEKSRSGTKGVYKRRLKNKSKKGQRKRHGK